MITLTQFRDIASCRVYRDDVDPLTLYAIPYTPTIALDEQGKPIISLVWYRRDVSDLTDEERKTRLGGGILTLSAELKITSEQEQEIREQIAAEPGLRLRLLGGWWNREIAEDKRKLAEALKINALPVKEGTVSISILAEGAEEGKPGEFVGHLVGVGKVSMLGNQRASFMAKLTQDGVVLLWNMLEKNLAAIRVAYDLRFDHRLDAVRMIVWCNARKAYSAVQEMWQSLQDNASWSTRTSGNTTRMTSSRDESQSASDVVGITAGASQASGVTIIPEGGADVVTPEQTEELIRIGNEMISEFLAGTILEFKPGEQAHFEEQPDLKTELPSYDGKKYGHHGIEYYNLKSWSEEMNVNLNHQFTSKAVLTSSVGPNDNLSNIFAGLDPEDFRTQIELDAAWYQYLDVQMVCTANFDEDPLDLVQAHLSYQASGPQGRIDNSKDFVFRKDSAVQRFSTYLASPNKKSYDYEYTVFYKGGTDKLTVAGKSDGSVLTLDTDRLGVLRVEAEVGLVDFDRLKTVIVKMWYGSGLTRKETEFTLSQQQPKQTWVEVIAREISEPYSYALTFIDKENRRIEVPEQSSRAKKLLVNQPLQEDLEVAIVPAGEFGAEGLISKVVVAFRYRDDGNNYKQDDIFILESSKDSKLWKVPLVNPDLRTYEYQATVFYSDGVTRTDDWRKSDSKVLPVGDPYGFRLQISPYLLKKSPFAFGTIHLLFNDPQAAIRAEKTFEITDFSKALYWRFRLGSPDRHTYRYQLTLFKDDGSEVKLAETEASQEVLVLKPPALPLGSAASASPNP